MATRAGFHPDFEIKAYPDVFWSVIAALSEAFFITRSFKPVFIGKSEYYAILARPIDEISVNVNTDQEVVIVLTSYSNFDIRTIESFEIFYELLESKRVDKGIRIVVSADDNIDRIIRHFLDQHPEYPIVIPIRISDLVVRKKASVVSAVRKNYVLRDLFGFQNPLHEDTFFFGRHSVVNTALDMARSGQNSSLFGLRKSGKTSTIYAIMRRARSVGVSAVMIDCQDPSVHSRSCSELLEYIVSEIRKTLSMKKLTSPLGSDLKSVSENFRLHMSTILSAAKSKILIIFDEIENISPNTGASQHWRDGSDTLPFWQILRSFIQVHGKGNISICFVGTNPKIIEMSEINNVANPVYLYSSKSFIPNLSHQETKEMIDRLGHFMGLNFSDKIIAKIHQDYGGHPFFTRQICSKIHQICNLDRPVDVSSANLTTANAEFAGQLDMYVRGIIESLYKEYRGEFDILAAAVEGKVDELREMVRDAPELVDHLIGYGLVERVGMDVDIRLAAVSSAVKRMIKSDSAETRWAEISARRNNLEVAIRSRLYVWTQVVDDNIWNDVFEGAISEKRKLEIKTNDPTIILSAKKSPLYLMELLSIIKNKRVLPKIDSRRSVIVERLAFINSRRADAHAKEIAPDEMDALRSAFDLLEAEFQSP